MYLIDRLAHRLFRMFNGHKKILLLLALLLVQQDLCAQPDTSWHKALDHALLSARLHRGDIRFRIDYAQPDPFRLGLVNRLMQRPLMMPQAACSMAQTLWSQPGLEPIIRQAGILLGDTLAHPENFWLRQTSLPPFGPPRRIRIKGLPDSIKNIIEDLTNELYLADNILCQAFSKLSMAEMALLRDSLPSLVGTDEESQVVHPDTVKILERLSEKFNYRLMSAVYKVQIRLILMASEMAARAVDRATARLKSLDAASLAKAKRLKPSKDHSGDVLFDAKTPLGRIIIGGPGRTTYNCSAALLVDLGGDDLYLCPAGASDSLHRLSVCLDLSGDDVYQARGDFSQGSGFMGIGMLCDGGGNEAYIGKRFSQGAGLLGAGLLWDEAGNDSYQATSACQAAGLWGIGILRDAKGNDNYRAGIYAQGFGYCAGLGALVELQGNDSYQAGMGTVDLNRYEDHFLSMSQGFAIGRRPDYSGGIGLILDRSGNDLYSCDIFGQGASYWFSFGAIVDKAGNDRYLGYQYAQGAGIHLACGGLFDLGGDDFYQSKGVSQGCGHDLAPGLLIDFSGNDTYAAHDLSQGAGSANGFGLLADLAGDDGYLVKSKTNTQGYGNPRREYGSIGVFWDLAGRDAYAGPGAEAWRWTSGLWGVGWDLDSAAAIWVNRQPAIAETLFYIKTTGRPELVPPRPDEPAPKDSVERLVDHLYNQCSSGQIAYAPMFRPSIDSLAALGSKAVPRLLGKLDYKSGTERQALEEIFKTMGEAAVPGLCAFADTGRPEPARAAVYFLGKIGSASAFPTISALAGDPSSKLRGAALDALSQIKIPESEKNIARIIFTQALGDSSEPIRRYGAYGLRSTGDRSSLPLLEGLLSDIYYGVRFTARDALIEITKKQNPKYETTGTRGTGFRPLDRISKALAAEVAVKVDTTRTAWRIFAQSDDWLVRLAALEAADSLLSAKQKTAAKQWFGRDECPVVRVSGK